MPTGGWKAVKAELVGGLRGSVGGRRGNEDEDADRSAAEYRRLTGGGPWFKQSF